MKDASDKLTHVVVRVDAHGRVASRTTKYFLGLLTGCWVVGRTWLSACSTSNAWVAEELYLAKGDAFADRGPETARKVAST